MNSKYTQEQMVAIIDFMVSKGVDKKRLENPKSFMFDKSARFDEKDLKTEAAVAFLMFLQDPGRSMHDIEDVFKQLTKAQQVYKSAFCDEFAEIAELMLGVEWFKQPDFANATSALLFSNASLEDKVYSWLISEAKVIPSFMREEEKLSRPIFTKCVEAALSFQSAPVMYGDYPLYDKKLEELAKVGMQYGHDISRLAHILTPQSIHNLFNVAKTKEEQAAVKSLVNNQNREEVAIYIDSLGDGKAFDALVVVDPSPKHISELKKLTATLEELSRNADKFKDVSRSVLSYQDDINRCLIDGRIDYNTVKAFAGLVKKCNTDNAQEHVKQMNNSALMSFLYAIPDVLSKVMEWLIIPGNEAMKKRVEKVFDEALNIKLAPIVNEQSIETSVGKGSDMRASLVTSTSELTTDKVHQR